MHIKQIRFVRKPSEILSYVLHLYAVKISNQKNAYNMNAMRAMQYRKIWQAFSRRMTIIILIYIYLLAVFTYKLKLILSIAEKGEG